jgi:glycosyltransferase involved in cell wall biosynthesis
MAGLVALRAIFRRPMRLLVVVPALNEERALPVLLDELPAVARGMGCELAVVVIDDGSTDRTAAVALERRVRVVRLCRNLGIGGAVQTGLRLALREGFDGAVQMDGDGQHPPTELPKLVAALQAAPAPDLVVGTRYRERQGWSSTRLRRFGSWWLKAVIWALTGFRHSDPTSGYRLYGPRALALFDRTYPYDYPEPEALAIALAARLRVTEVPVAMRERQGGSSSISGLQGPYYMLKVTLAVMLAYVRNVRRTRKERALAGAPGRESHGAD